LSAEVTDAPAGLATARQADDGQPPQAVRAYLRFFGSELRLVFRRRRNQLLLLVVFGFPLLIGIGLTVPGRTIAVSREFEHDADEARRAARITDSIEKALRGDLQLPEVVAKRAGAKARLKAFVIEGEVTINNGWSNRYTMVEVTGLDRPGLLFELTATLSKLNLNIASAHVATFGERVVDVFYVTDLFGAKITSATRQATIKRALLGLLSPTHESSAKAAKTAAAGAVPAK